MTTLTLGYTPELPNPHEARYDTALRRYVELLGEYEHLVEKQRQVQKLVDDVKVKC